VPAAGLSLSVGPPDATTFCRWLSPRDAHNRCVLDLHRLLGASQAAAALPARLDAIEGLARWVIAGPRPPLVDTEPVGAPAPIVRLGVLGRALERVPEWRAALADLLGAVMAETSALRLFADVGLPNDRGFLGEASDRLSRRLLPAPPNPLDLADLLARCFRGAKEAGWLDALVRYTK